MTTGTPGIPLLAVIRGNSGSGKTTTAREVRRRAGRGAALVGQDYVRRVLFREHGGHQMQPVAPAFIAATARATLNAGYHVIRHNDPAYQRPGDSRSSDAAPHPLPRCAEQRSAAAAPGSADAG